MYFVFRYGHIQESVFVHYAAITMPSHAYSLMTLDWLAAH